MKDSLKILKDTVQVLTDSATVTATDGVEGIERSKTISINTWIAIDILVVTAILFVLIYKERQFLVFKLREFFSSDNRFFSQQSFSGSNKMGVLAILTVVVANSIGLIFTGISNLYPELFNILTSIGDNGEFGFGMMVKVTGMVILFVLIKAMMYVVINWVFFRLETNVKWMQAYAFITAAFAFVFYPFALMVLFVGLSTKILLICLVILFISYEILILYKQFVNFKANKYGFLLIFLYFCTVELMPALFVWKNIHQTV